MRGSAEPDVINTGPSRSATKTRCSRWSRSSSPNGQPVALPAAVVTVMQPLSTSSEAPVGPGPVVLGTRVVLGSRLVEGTGVLVDVGSVTGVSVGVSLSLARMAITPTIAAAARPAPISAGHHDRRPGVGASARSVTRASACREAMASGACRRSRFPALPRARRSGRCGPARRRGRSSWGLRVGRRGGRRACAVPVGGGS